MWCTGSWLGSHPEASLSQQKAPGWRQHAFGRGRGGLTPLRPPALPYHTPAAAKPAPNRHTHWGSHAPHTMALGRHGVPGQFGPAVLAQWCVGPVGNWANTLVFLSVKNSFRGALPRFFRGNLPVCPANCWSNTGQTLGVHSLLGQKPSRNPENLQKTQKIAQSRGSFGRCISYACRSRE